MNNSCSLHCATGSTLHALLAGDRSLLALTSAGVCTSTLTTTRQTLAMTLAAVAANVLEALNILLHLTAKRALQNVILIEQLADVGQFLVVKRAGFAVAINAGLYKNVLGKLRANAVDVLKSEKNLLALGNVDTC